MVNLALALSAVCLVLAVLTLLGYSSLLAELRQLQDVVMGLSRFDQRNAELAGDGIGVVLVTEDGCIACHQRVAEFAKLGDQLKQRGLRAIVLHSGRLENLPPMSNSVRIAGDAATIGRLSIGILPSVVVVDASGTELARTVVGEPLELERIVAWAADQVSVGKGLSRDQRSAGVES